MSSILEANLHAGNTLPGEVYRLLELIGCLDTKSDLINQNLQKLYDQFYKSKDPALTEQIQGLQTHATNLADEKLEITEQIKEVLKQHMDLVEKEMSKIEAKDKNLKYDQIRMIDNDYEDMEVETNMGGYCICRGAVDSDDWICCDNENCNIQWYHWACVGITGDPGDGAWYCPNCSSGSGRRYN